MRYLFIIILLYFVCSFASGQTAKDIPAISITVSDLDKVLPFYQNVLTFRQVDQYELKGEELQWLSGIQDADLQAEVAVLQLGSERIELIEFINEDHQLSIPADSRSNDLWFQHIAIVVSDIDMAYRRFRDFKVSHVSTAPQTLPGYLPAAAGISAFYFRDPDGHNLEVIHFPEGKGDPRWQTDNNALFLGIDHTAIGIADTDLSIAFYTEQLGLKIAGASENYGPEQERLNQVFGAHLIITGLRASSGLGVEFLDYLAPPGGRPYPDNSRVTDLWHWHTSVRVDDIENVFDQLMKTNTEFISSRIAMINNRKCFMIRDPDGHALLIAQDDEN